MKNSRVQVKARVETYEERVVRKIRDCVVVNLKHGKNAISIVVIQRILHYTKRDIKALAREL